MIAIEVSLSSDHPVDGLRELHRHELHRDFQTNRVSQSQWQHVQVSLPVQMRGHYRILVTADAGLLHDIPPGEHRSVQVTNLTLSKECFSIGKYWITPTFKKPPIKF